MRGIAEILLLYLDNYHLEDVLFLRHLGKRLAGMPHTQPRMMVHGSGETAERLLEGEGIIPERRGSTLLVEDDRGRSGVERSIRQANQKVVATLTESLVAAVSVQGTDRNLIAREEDRVVLRHPAWLLGIVQKGVVPVISSMAASAGSEIPREVDIADLLPAFSLAFGVPLRLLLFTRDNRPGWFEDQKFLDSVRISHIWPEKPPLEVEGMRPVISERVHVFLTSPDGLSASGEVHGTRVLP